MNLKRCLCLHFKVSVVIPTYNRYHDLKECLDSIFSLKNKPYEVIVVDSHSKDQTPKLKDRFPIRFISIREKNRQYAKNIGISMAKGDIISFLDDDVILSEDWLTEIVKPYEDKTVGGVGGRVLPYGTPADSYVEISKKDVGKVFTNGLVIGNFDLPADDMIEVDSFIGCNMSFRRDLLLAVGGFDENYLGTGYRDDTDLCLRIRKLGYRLIYNPKALVWHKFRGKKLDRNWAYWYIRNHTYFYLKNFFRNNVLKLPSFLLNMFFPPRDYVLKSQIKLNMDPLLIPTVLKGLLDGYNTWKRSSFKASITFKGAYKRLNFVP